MEFLKSALLSIALHSGSSDYNHITYLYNTYIYHTSYKYIPQLFSYHDWGMCTLLLSLTFIYIVSTDIYQIKLAITSCSLTTTEIHTSFQQVMGHPWNWFCTWPSNHHSYQSSLTLHNAINVSGWWKAMITLDCPLQQLPCSCLTYSTHLLLFNASLKLAGKTTLTLTLWQTTGPHGINMFWWFYNFPVVLTVTLMEKLINWIPPWNPEWVKTGQ